jgi:hypothetical protein
MLVIRLHACCKVDYSKKDAGIDSIFVQNLNVFNGLILELIQSSRL